MVKIRSYLGPVFHGLARQRESEIKERYKVGDHVHMLVRMPPKDAVTEPMGYIKGQSALAVARGNPAEGNAGLQSAHRY